MNTKELMIGNYVLRHTGEITKVLEILSHMVLIKAEDYMIIKSFTIPSHSISPIFLIKEHLFKLGFEEYYKDRFFKGGCYISGRSIMHTLQEHKWVIDNNVLLKSVHELQNYYFLKTKKELTYDFS